MFSIQKLIYSYQFKLNFESTFSTIFNFYNIYLSVPTNLDGIFAIIQNENILGISNFSSNSIANNAIKFTLDGILPAENIKSTANVDTLTIGINNIDNIKTNKGNDTIVGIANAAGFGVATIASRHSPTLSNIDTNLNTTVEVVVDAIGISNLAKINTDQGNDTIIGLANTAGFGIAKTTAQNLSAFRNEFLVDLSSESLAVVDTLTIGIDNQSEISTGQGHDIILGMAGTVAMSKTGANLFANNFSKNVIGDLKIIDDIEIGISSRKSTATTETVTNVLGIINSGVIMTGNGNDKIIGKATNESFSEALTITKAKSVAHDTAIIRVDSSSLAISRGNIVGIVNQGKIDTGKGNDSIIGITFNTANAVANADADAVTLADNSNTQTRTKSIADISEVTSIGIDNTSGLIETGEGNDSIIGYGAVGIKGGNIQTGKGNDSIIGYGDLVGIEDSRVALGEGDDYFKAVLVNFDPLIDKSLAEVKSRSIKNTSISGGLGNDIFEIDSFAASVSIDAGLGNDVLKLSGNIEDYIITQGSSEHQIITVQNTDSILVVMNVESFYFGNNDFAHSFNDLV